VVFVFAGQGSQWAGMGRELAGCCPVFAAKLAECGQALARYADWDLGEVLAGADGAPGLETAQVVQPVLWAVMVALAAVWQAAGVVPDAVIGHSQGEIAAATAAGILTLEDAARVVTARSRALSGLGAAGGMVSVVMPAAAVEELTGPWGQRLSVAAENGPAATVVSGDPAALAEFEAMLAARHVLRWPVPAADFIAHSPAADQLGPVLARDLAAITPAAGHIRMFSTVTCTWTRGEDLDGGYWFANLRQRVRFGEAVQALAADGYRTFAEISPHPLLTSAVAETLEQSAGPAPVITGTLDRQDAGARRILSVLARVHVRGVPVDWAAVLGSGTVVDLPTYAFQRQRYWRRSADPAALPAGGGPATAGWRYRESWEPVPEPTGAPLPGTWLAVIPVGSEQAAGYARVLADAVVVEIGPAEDRSSAAAVVTARVAGRPVAGVVSLLALGPEPTARTLTLVQALGDAGVDAPLWALTHGAVAAVPGEVPTYPVQAAVWGPGRHPSQRDLGPSAGPRAGPGRRRAALAPARYRADHRRDRRARRAHGPLGSRAGRVPGGAGQPVRAGCRGRRGTGRRAGRGRNRGDGTSRGHRPARPRRSAGQPGRTGAVIGGAHRRHRTGHRP
jgi:malonyl CoA-acyl carrier protein transacylase